jgi:hypothetical protein
MGLAKAGWCLRVSRASGSEMQVSEQTDVLVMRLMIQSRVARAGESG